MQREREPAVHVPRPLAAAAAYGWRIVAVAAALYVVAWGLAQLFVVVVPLVLALFVAASVHPLVERLRRRGLPSGVATVIVLALVLALLTLLFWWLSGRVRGQFDDLSEQVRQGIDQVEQWLTTGPLSLDPQRVSELEQQITSPQGAGSGLVGRILGRARQLIEVLAGIVLTVFATFFLLKDGQRIGAWVQRQIPEAYRSDATAITSRVRLVMRWYLIGVAGVGLADALLIALALVVLGVPLVVPLAVLTFFGAFFPVVGAFVAGAIAALVALVAGGFQTALLVVLAAVIVQQVEGNLLQPLIMGRMVKLHPLVTLFAVAAGLIIAGLVGGFLAVPLTAIGAQVAGFYWHRDALVDAARA